MPQISVKTHLMPFFMLSIWQKGITQELLFYILLNLVVIYLIGFGVEEMLKKTKEQEQKTGIEEIKKRLEEFCKKVENQIGPPCSELVSKILVPLGHPVEEILKAADEESCDAIVLGTHGKGFLRQTFLGSVAGSVLERTRKPVFIIPLPSEKITFDWDSV